MSMFDLKGGSTNNWNYSDNTKAGYTEMIEGTCVEISNPQALDFSTKQPAFWPDGNPKRNLQVVLLMKNGQEVSWTFSPKSAAANACLASLDPQGTREQVSLDEILGKFVRVQTQAGVYNARNPRPWWVTILGDGEASAVRGCKDLSQPQPMQAMPAPAPAPVPTAQKPDVQLAMSGGAGLPMATPNNMYPTQFQAAQQAAQQAVAQQNFQQAAPPVNQVPTDAYGVYDQDIPF